MRGRTLSGWRLGELIDESWRRMRGVHLVLAALVASLAAAVTLAGSADLLAALDIVEAREQQGVDLFVTSVPDTEVLDGGMCERIASTAGVRAAGAYYGENITANATWVPAGIAVPIVDVSPGGLHVWWPAAPAEGGLFVGDDLAATIGLSAGMDVQLDGQQVPISAVLPRTVLPDTLQAGVVRVVPAVDGATECWVRLDPGARGAARDIAESAFLDNTLITAAFAELDDLSADPLTALDGPTHLAWTLAAGAALVLMLVVALGGRTEVGIYRATGSDWSDLVAMSVVQTVVLVAYSVSLAVSATLLVVHLRTGVPSASDEVWFVVQPTLLYALTLVVLGPTIQLLGTAGALVDQMKV